MALLAGIMGKLATLVLPVFERFMMRDEGNSETSKNMRLEMRMFKSGSTRLVDGVHYHTEESMKRKRSIMKHSQPLKGQRLF